MTYDLIVIGGGLAGSTLATNMARNGYSVLLLERESRFRDRIRGEAMHPWGTTQTKALGIYEHLLESCGHVADHWKQYLDGKLVADRDLPATNPHGVGEMHFYHPAMQEALLQLARDAGVEVHRGARLSALDASEAAVIWRQSGASFEARSRLVVGADGSRSKTRKLAGFEVEEDGDRLMLAGVLMENGHVPDDSVHLFQGPEGVLLFFPQSPSRTRSYFNYPSVLGAMGLHGDSGKAEYLSLCKRYGVPDAWLEQAELAGPLAEFHGADVWVEHPAKRRVVLVGDAAAKPDPSWGTGLSLSLLDVRTLRDELLADDDWPQAGQRYAARHKQYYGRLRDVEHWFADLIFSAGPEADARRARVLPRLERPGAPDIVGLGPESPVELPA